MPIPRDYRTIENPKLLTRDVLHFVNTYHPLPTNSRDVAKRFNIPLAEASTRLRLLYRWGVVKRTIPKYSRENKRPKGKPPYNYTMSKWGQFMVRKWADLRG